MFLGGTPSRSITALSACLTALLAVGPAAARPGAEPDWEEEDGPAPEPKRPPRTWEGAYFAHGHIVDADGGGAGLTREPTYMQSFSFRPRVGFFDGCFLGLRLDLELDLSSSDEVEVKRDPWISDLYVDAGVDRPALTIPMLGIAVGPRLRIGAPTSTASRDRSLQLVLAPGLRLGRSFALHDGWWLSRLELFYRFFFYKYFYARETRGGTGGTGGPGPALPTDIDDPALHPTGSALGATNVSWRLENVLGLRLQLLPRLSLSASVSLLNDYLYAYKLQYTPAGVTFDGISGAPDPRATIVALFDLTYRLFDWLWLGAGVSHVAHRVDPGSYYAAYVHDRTAVFVDLTVPVDGVIQALQGR